MAFFLDGKIIMECYDNLILKEIFAFKRQNILLPHVLKYQYQVKQHGTH